MNIEGALGKVGMAVFGAKRWRRWRYKKAKRIAKANQFEIYKPQLIWLKDPDFTAVKKRVEDLGIIGIPNDRCYTLLELARRLRSIDGDIAECGVRFGKSTHFILGGLGSLQGRSVEVFDSFQGLSDPAEEDRASENVQFWERGDLAVGKDAFIRNLSGYADFINVHQGWIPEKFHEVDEKRFLFVHIDVDLFEPTRDCLEFFYPRLVQGGVIVCDDYGSAYCPGAKRALDEFFSDKSVRMIALPTGQAIVFKA